MNNYDIIEQAVKNYVDTCDITSIYDLIFIRKLNNIILSEPDKIYNYKFRKHVTLKKNISYVSNFLKELNEDYQKDFYERLIDGTFIFEQNKYDCAYSEYDDEEKQRIIYIPLRGNLEDSFAIAHEFMHDKNLIEDGEENITRYFYTEALSILIEFLLQDYFVKNKIKDARINNNYTLSCCRTKAIYVDFNLNLIQLYLEKGYIDKGVIFEIIGYYEEDCIYEIMDTITKIKETKELTLDFEQPYIIGTLIATYMYNRIHDNNSIYEMFDINEMIKICDFDQILNYLDLTYTLNELTPSSYEKLKVNYKRYIKQSG